MVVCILLALLGLFGIYLYINGEEEIEEEHLFVCFLMAVVFSLATYGCYNNWQFNKHHKIEYIKPKIEVLKKLDDRIVLMIDDKLYEKEDIKWLNTNNIYYEVKYYKDEYETNLKVMVQQ